MDGRWETAGFGGDNIPGSRGTSQVVWLQGREGDWVDWRVSIFPGWNLYMTHFLDGVVVGVFCILQRCAGLPWLDMLLVWRSHRLGNCGQIKLGIKVRNMDGVMVEREDQVRFDGRNVSDKVRVL